MRLRLHRLALAELDRAADWYDGREPGLGFDFRDAIDDVLEAALVFPMAARAWRRSADIRVALVDRFPFSIPYRIDGEVIVVLAIAHAKRRPGYWAKRR